MTTDDALTYYSALLDETEPRGHTQTQGDDPPHTHTHTQREAGQIKHSTQLYYLQVKGLATRERKKKQSLFGSLNSVFCYLSTPN